MSSPILIACSHGTADPTARATVARLIDAVREDLGVEVRSAVVDVESPPLPEVLAGIPVGDGVSAVVVPLLVAGGYHVHHDVARAVALRSDVIAAPALGPDPRLVDIVLARLRGAGVAPNAAVVLVPAGSSDPRARADSAAAVTDLARRWDGPVSIGFAAAGSPRVEQAVSDARAEHGGTVAIASFLLAPGTFQRRLESAGADVVTDSLAPAVGTDAQLVAIVADRYRDTLRNSGN